MTTTETSNKPAAAKNSAKRRFAAMPTKDVSAELSEQEVALSAPPQVKPPSKISAVITLLKRDQGATLAEMIETTGWLPHTTRAALTGLRKRGHEIEKSKRKDVTCYRIMDHA